ncbi:MAG: hypothetical protein ORN54_06345, partial [Cyclobacteriaceae bacterium]|nr:hypothetical protein [Cyclobacteriaceae bacterium]
TWDIISGDLTTNDKEKQKQHESGGITMDATGAENHCTILAIAPSPKEKGVLWVGTDDGQVQLSRDGGKTWTNLTSKITGMPKGAWIPQIQASTHNAAEVLVVVNNYRQFDFKPYLFRSKDYGQTWENMVTPSQVGENNYTLAVVQDLVEPKLIFVGTENGLWVSLDEGKTYTRWTSGYPAGVPTMDLVIHPREHDLAIGTFGRALYILDDIRPLRVMVKEGTQVLNRTVRIFDAPDAYQVETQDPAGILFPGNAMFQGENRTTSAMISFVINKPETKKDEPKSEDKKADAKKDAKPVDKKDEKKEDAKDDKKPKYDSLTLEVFNGKGEKIRTIKQKAPEDNGLNRTTWSLNEKGVRQPSREKAKAGAPEPSGTQVLPGTYKLRMSFGGAKDSAMINVKPDPRYTSSSIMEARYKLLKDLQTMTAVGAEAMNQLRESKEIAEEFEKKMKEAKRDDLKEATEKTKAIKDSIGVLMDYIVGKEDKRQGIVRQPDPTPMSYVGNAQFFIRSSKDPISTTDQRVFQQAEQQINKVMQRVNFFYEKTWPGYRALMEKVSISPFKDYQPLKRN